MNMQEMNELAQKAREAIQKLSETEDRKEMKELGDFFVTGMSLLVEVACDVKRIANALDSYNEHFIYGKENN